LSMKTAVLIMKSPLILTDLLMVTDVLAEILIMFCNMKINKKILLLSI